MFGWVCVDLQKIPGVFATLRARVPYRGQEATPQVESAALTYTYM